MIHTKLLMKAGAEVTLTFGACGLCRSERLAELRRRFDGDVTNGYNRAFRSFEDDSSDIPVAVLCACPKGGR